VSEVQAVLNFMSEATGLVFPPQRTAELGARVAEAMTRASVRDAGEYLSALETDEAMFDDLASALTVGETYFFREPAQFDFLRAHAIPELLRKSATGGVIRAWSAGCATGEEAYSLAIFLQEMGIAGARVLGTDLAPERLERAREARYGAWSLRGVPELTVQRYFRPQGKYYLLDANARRGVTFRKSNLLAADDPSAPGAGEMDLIFCRNVLIYLGPEVIASVAARMLSALNEGGWLILSASDPPLGTLADCETVATPAGVAYRRRGGQNLARPVADTATPEWHGSREVDAAAEPTSVAPAAVDARVPTAAGLYALGDYPGAAAAAASTIALGSGAPEDWALWARSLANQGKLEDASRTCDAGLQKHPLDAEITGLRAVLLLSGGGRVDEAAAAARRALYLDRSNIVAHLMLAQALVRLDECAGALRALRNAARLLAAIPEDQLVRGADDESAGRLLSQVQLQIRLLEGAA
jgi:chemotaxis protein methyltransferase CheR